MKEEFLTATLYGVDFLELPELGDTFEDFWDGDTHICWNREL